jgi:hypothetical protein
MVASKIYPNSLLSSVSDPYSFYPDPDFETFFHQFLLIFHLRDTDPGSQSNADLCLSVSVADPDPVRSAALLSILGFWKIIFVVYSYFTVSKKTKMKTGPIFNFLRT